MDRSSGLELQTTETGYSEPRMKNPGQADEVASRVLPSSVIDGLVVGV
jgi:hypothetical protein